MRPPSRLLVPFVALALAAAGCGGEKTIAAAPETVEGTIEQATVAEGDPAEGETIFAEVAQPSCGSCHTYGAAGSESETGPNLDESLEGKDAQYIYDSIVNPSAEITEGFQDIMPKDYGEQLTDEQLADLVAFLNPAS